MVIAIDGPAGAGKSTVARAVAARLGFVYLDTGAMYRCVALAVERLGIDAADAARIVRIELGERVLLEGEDVTAEIREPQVGEAASRVAADPAVRAALVEQQRALLARGDWVAEGRDIGTVVVPHAELKVFLTASESERAARRGLELGLDPERVAAEQRDRDHRDRERAVSPLLPAADAVELDSSGMSVEQVVARVAELAAARGIAPAGSSGGPATPPAPAGAPPSRQGR